MNVLNPGKRKKYSMDEKDRKLTGVKEIARRAKVSIGTVDRVINNRPGVSPKTHENIKQIIKEMDYQPNLLGRRLASNKITHFVTLMPAVSEETSFWEAPLKGVGQAESEIKQYNIKIEKYFYDQNDKGSFVRQTQKILKNKADGILLVPSFIEEAIHFTEKCRDLNIPYVFIDSDIPDRPSLSYIGPDLYRSGYLAANLARYLVARNDRILIVNISTEIENHHLLLRKEEGFRGYFAEHELPNGIEKTDIRKISYASVKNNIARLLAKHEDIKVIFVTNSKVSLVARYLKEVNKDILLIGYDFLKENIGYLEEEVIDFLICQKPGEQAYRGIMALYKHIVLKLSVEEYTYMPIDIIMKANSSFYSN
ncbi:LacI family DNA-binding transcriptional regulator [Flavitalea flava]